MPEPRSFGTVRICLRLLPYAWRRRAALAAILAVTLIGIGLNALKPWPMKVLIDNILHQRPMAPALAAAVGQLPGTATREGLVTWVVAATILIFVLRWALKLATSFANIGFAQGMRYDLAADVFDHLQRLSLGFHSRSPIGDSIRRLTTDCTCVATIISGALLPAAASLLTLVTLFAVMWRMDHALTLLAMAAVPPLLLVLRRYTSPISERSYEQQEVEARMFNLVEQTLSSIPIVKAFGREERADARFRASTDAVVDAALSSTRAQIRFKVLTGLTTAAGTAAILWVGSQHVLSGAITIGSLLVFVAYLGSLYGPLQSLLYSPSTIYGALGSARRVMEILEAEPEVKDVPGAAALGAARGEVALEGVTFGYDGGRPVLRGLSLQARPGETVAIVGATGAGKSTLVGLIPRFFDPWEGRVTIDGRDVREVQLKSLRGQISIVLQEPFLFPTTIAGNIAYGRPEASREEVEGAARAANAHAFIERLPHGYETVLGERGSTLSGGERQRLSIARALLKDAPVLILDEPTSALDAETEGALLQALRRLVAGRTTFVIAHRLSTTRLADRIVVLTDGRITEAGTHEELLGQDGLYARFHHVQLGQPSTAQRRVG